jgi:hypothetical protein
LTRRRSRRFHAQALRMLAIGDEDPSRIFTAAEGFNLPLREPEPVG